MGPETGILNGYKGIDQALGQLFVCGLQTVGSGLHQSLRQIALAVINHGRVPAGFNACHVDLRRSVDDPFKDTVAQAHRKYDSHSKKDQNQLHKP